MKNVIPPRLVYKRCPYLIIEGKPTLALGLSGFPRTPTAPQTLTSGFPVITSGFSAITSGFIDSIHDEYEAQRG